MKKTYKSIMYKGSEIRIGNTPDRTGKYWATAFSGMITEEGKTKTSALNKAKAKITKAIKSFKR